MLFWGNSCGQSRHLFQDTEHLACGPGYDHEAPDDLNETSESPVPACAELFLGFPCVDVSKLNPNSAKNAWVVKDSAKRTGAVFCDAMDYVHGVLLDQDEQALEWNDCTAFKGMILENVMGLRDPPKGINPETCENWRSNLDYVNLRIQKLRHFMVAFSLTPSQFTMPVSRHRLWMICLPEILLEHSGLSFEDAKAYALQTMNRLCAKQVRPLDDFLLDESSPFVKNELLRAARLPIQNCG